MDCYSIEKHVKLLVSGISKNCIQNFKTITKLVSF